MCTKTLIESESHFVNPSSTLALSKDVYCRFAEFELNVSKLPLLSDGLERHGSRHVKPIAVSTLKDIPGSLLKLLIIYGVSLELFGL